MLISTVRFGSLDIPEKDILTFPSGVLGFPDWSRYVILDHDRDMPFKWLQCVERPELAFVIIDPALVKAEYHITLSPDVVSEVRGADTDELDIAVILTVPSDDCSAITANLRGPLLMNPRTRLCKQLVLQEDLPTRYPLFSAHCTEQVSSAIERGTY